MELQQEEQQRFKSVSKDDSALLEPDSENVIREPQQSENGVVNLEQPIDAAAVQVAHEELKATMQHIECLGGMIEQLNSAIVNSPQNGPQVNSASANNPPDVLMASEKQTTAQEEQPDSAMINTYDELAERLVQLLAKTTKSQVWVGVAGAPGAGKSTLARQVAKRLSEKHGIQAAVVPMDGYHYSKAELDQFDDPNDAHLRRGAPFTFDVNRLISDMQKCKECMSIGEPFLFPDFDHSAGDPELDAIRVDGAAKVVLFEGNYLLLSELPWGTLKDLFFDESWFISCNINVLCERLAKRHMKAWNWAYEKALERASGPDKSNMQLVNAQSPANADVVVESK